MRKLNKIVMAMSLLAPVAAYPLGVGELILKSALNENLSANIALDLSSDEAIKDVTIQLASPEKFSEAGITWHYFLSDISFDIVEQGPNKFFIKAQSKDIIQEPFLEFLLEITWPKGQVFKTFTLLIDPPITPVDDFTAPVSRTIQKASKPNKIIAAKTSISLDNKVLTHLVKQGEYGPTQRNDSLWKIAKKINQDKSITVEQMMMGLYQANKHAFYKNNVNALMAGKMLKVPKPSQIKRSSAKQASTDFYQQNDKWLGKKARKPSKVKKPVKKAAKQLILVAPVVDEVSDSEVLSSESESQKKLRLENEDLKERLAKLEERFSLMENMLVIKDQALANLQSTQAHKEKNRLVVEAESKQAITQPIVKEQAPEVESKEESDEFISLWASLLAFLVILLGIIVWRKQKKSEVEEEQEDNIFKSSDPLFSEDIIEEDVDFELPILEQDSGLIQENLSALSVDEVLLSADTSLAYGKYQEAEENLRAALLNSPNKDEYKLKLLEIFYNSENDVAFGEYAQILKKEGREKDGVFWDKVLDMGRDFMPNEESFFVDDSEAVIAGDEPEKLEQPASEFDTLDNDNSTQLDLKEPDLAKETPADIQTEVEEVFEFDLDSNSVDEEQPDAEASLLDESIDELNTLSDELNEITEVFEFDLNSEDEQPLDSKASLLDESIDELNTLSDELNESNEVFEFDLLEAEDKDLTADSSDQSEDFSDIENFEFTVPELDDSVIDAPEGARESDDMPEVFEFSDAPFTDDSLDIENDLLDMDEAALAIEESFPAEEKIESDLLELLDEKASVIDETIEMDLELDVQKDDLDSELKDFDFDFSVEGDAAYIPIDLTKKEEIAIQDIPPIEEEFDFDLDVSSFPSSEEGLNEESLSSEAGIYDFQTSFELAQMYIAMKDITAAKDVLNEIREKGSDEDKQKSEELMQGID